MNGVDAVALATGNDFRAIEAAAHRLLRPATAAIAAHTLVPRRRRRPRRRARHADEGRQPWAAPWRPIRRCASITALLGSPGATELASVMGAVGLAQNYAALRALSTAGIQQNHMTLHARSVASAAQVPEDVFDTVVEALIESGEIKVWKARELARRVQQHAAPIAAPDSEPRSSACGKVILLGEHACGLRTLGVGRAHSAGRRSPGHGCPRRCATPDSPLGHRAARTTGERAPAGRSRHPRDAPRTPPSCRAGHDDRSVSARARAMGLGGSSALAVAVVRALDTHYAPRTAERGDQFLRFRVRKGGAWHRVGRGQHDCHLRTPHWSIANRETPEFHTAFPHHAHCLSSSASPAGRA